MASSNYNLPDRLVIEKLMTSGNEDGTAGGTWSSLSPRVQLALMVGLPIALVATTGAVYWFWSRKPSQSQDKRIDRKTNSQDDQVEIIAIDEQDPFLISMSYKTKGNRNFKDGKYDAAIYCYTEAIKVCPEDKKEDLATYYQNRAASYEMQKKYVEVIEDCTKAVTLNKKYIKALQRRAKALESKGDISDSLVDITAVCILEQFSNQANLLMTDRLLRQQSKTKAKDFVRNRTPHMPSKHFIRHYFVSFMKDPIVKDCTVDSEGLMNLLNSFAEQQQQGDDDATPRYHLIKGTIEILMGNIEAGEKEIEQVVSMSNCDVDIKVNALIKLGTIRVHELENDSNGIKTALECFDEAIKLDPSNPDIYIHRAQIHLLAEQVEEAKNDLDKCCSLATSFPSALAQKLYVHFRCAMRFNDDYAIKKCLKNFEEAMDTFPMSSEVHSLYAQALMERQEYSKADDYFQKAIKCDTNDANLYVHRGILHLQWNNDVDKAVKFLEKALMIDKQCQFAYEMLGSIEVQQGKLQKGIDCFDKALESAQTELDCCHLFALRDAAEAQMKAAKILGIELPVQ